MELLVRQAVGWLSLAVAVIGFVVCATQLGRVRWAGTLMTGFALQALVASFYRFLTLLAPQMGGIGGALAFVSLVGVLGSAAVVAGVAGLLSELRRADRQEFSPPPVR